MVTITTIIAHFSITPTVLVTMEMRAATNKQHKFQQLRCQNWLSTNSNKRHNRKCENYRKTRGYPCKKDEGSPCGKCGG